jgi:uncharacterized protein YjdB
MYTGIRPARTRRGGAHFPPLLSIIKHPKSKEMKKIHYLLTLAACIAITIAVSCGEDETPGYTPEAIENPVTGITIANATADGIVLSDVGATEQVQVSATPSNAGDADRYHYSYVSGDQRIFTVSPAGVVTATGAGVAWLTVIPNNNAALAARCKVTVVGVRVTSIDIASGYEARTLARTNAAGPTLNLASYLTVAPADASIKRLRYSSSDPTVATVDEDGVVTAVWEGETVIRIEATDHSGVYAESVITVTITPVATLSFYANTFNNLNINSKMNQTGNYDLSPADYSKGTSSSSPIRYQPTNATRNILEYASSDEEVLEIQSTSSNGFRLIPKKGGRATITATATDGHGATVTSNPINVYGIYPHTGWTIVASSPTGELQDGGDTWGGPIENMFVDGKQVGFYRQGTTQLPTGSYPYFIIDFGESLPFNYVILSHSWAGNYNSGTRSNRLSMSGSNDNANYTSIVSGVTASPGYNYISVLSQVHTYRYLKVEIWNTTNYTGASGTGVAATPINVVYDFNLGYLPPL